MIIKEQNKSYQKLVDKCKKAYEDKNMDLAIKFWCDIHDLLDKNLNEFDKYDDENRHKCYQMFHDYMQQFTDEQVFSITDYGRQKEYKKLGY